VAAAADASTAADRSDHSRTERKKHPSSASRVAQHDPEPPPGGTAEPEPSVPAPAPGPQAARSPVTEPPPAEPPRTAPKPAAVPAAPTGSREPPVVSGAAISKRSGAIPAIKVSGVVGEFADVVVKLCIDEQGAVSSVKVVKAPPGIAGELQHGLQSWRYAPYVNAAGVQSAACFPVSFRVVFKN